MLSYIIVLAVGYVCMVYLLASFLAALPYRSKARNLMSFPKVSAIIATKNEENVIGKTLEALRKSDYPELEIIVADSSTDGTRKIAKKYADKVLEVSASKPQALNMAVRHAKGEVLYFADADTRVEKNTIKKLVCALSDGAATGICMPENKKGIAARMSRLQIAMLYAMNLVSMRLLKTAATPGRNFAICRKTLRSAGGFRDVLVEDIDLSMRLYEKGKKCVLVPAYAKEQAPSRLSWYASQQQRWLCGGFGVMRRFSPRPAKRAFMLPAAAMLGMLPLFFLLLLAGYILTSSSLFLLAILFPILFASVAAVRFLDADDLLLMPAVLLAMSFTHAFVLLGALWKKLRGSEIAWYKTPKEKF